VDLQVACATLDWVSDPDRALNVVRDTAARLRIATSEHRRRRDPYEWKHGFIGFSDDRYERLTPQQRETWPLRRIREQWYTLPDTPIERSPYYQRRVQMLEDGVESMTGRLEAHGLKLALHENMFTFDFLFITLEFPDETVGPFLGLLGDLGECVFPVSEIEERTGLFGPLVHMQFVEFLAAIKREAIPSLYIRDPSGYAEHGDVARLLEAMDISAQSYEAMFKALAPSLKVADVIQEDARAPIPMLTGEVGSPERIAQFEHYLFAHGVTAPDIDALLEQGR
jgi:hypothetical protein